MISKSHQSYEHCKSKTNHHIVNIVIKSVRSKRFPVLISITFRYEKHSVIVPRLALFSFVEFRLLQKIQT